MSVLDDLGDLVTAGLDNINPFIKVYQLIEGFNQGNQAEKIANMSEAQIAQAVAAANEVRDYYKEGGKVMSSNMQALLDAYGNYGQITPENLQAFLKFVGDARIEEEASDKSDYDEKLSDLSSTVDQKTAEDQALMTDTEGTFRDFADYILSTADSLYRERDAQAAANAPETFDMASQFDRIAQRFTNIRMANAKKAIDVAAGNALASITEGFEKSTISIETEKAMADFATEKLNQAILDGVNDAKNYIGANQTMVSNQQNMTNTERKMDADLTTSGLNYATGELGNQMAAGAYGQDYVKNYLNMRGINLDYQNILENSPFTWLKNLDAMTTGEALEDYTTATSLMATNADLATGYVNTVSDMVTAPYKFSATGAANSTTTLNNAATNAANLAGLYGEQAGGLFYGSGYESGKK